MGDVSNEPSMEDILSSIKRIIAEEGESVTTGRPRRAARPSAPPVIEPSDDEVLELREPVPAELAEAAPAVSAVTSEKEAPITPVAEPILSSITAEATRGPLEQLSRMIVKPDVAGSDTLEGLVKDLIRPMLREWLDANLPRMVEEMVQREITRITNRS